MRLVRTTLHGFVVLSVLLVVAVGSAVGGDVRCIYGGKFYGPGAVRCQDGSQQQCVAGTWKDLGLDCADEGAGAAGMREQPGVPVVGGDVQPPPPVPSPPGDAPPAQPGVPVIPR